MLFFIAIHGGLLIMVGQHSRSESLFYYFRIEDQVPENHLLITPACRAVLQGGPQAIAV